MPPARTITVLATVLATASVTATVTGTLAPQAEAMAKPQHQFRDLRGAEVGHSNTFYIEGRVPTFPGGRIKVLQNVARGRYELYRKVRTSQKGGFRTPITQVGTKRTCYKVQVPATPVYSRTTSRVIGCIESD